MTIPVKDTGGRTFESMPQGTQHAICDMIVDLGAQNGSWQGQPKVSHQVYIRWQVPIHRVEYEYEGKQIKGPMTIGKVYTASLSSKANLRKDLEGWRGKQFTPAELESFDLEAVVGANCYLVVTHSIKGDNTYANVTSIAALPAGVNKIAVEGETLTYSSDNTACHDKLPKWIKEKIAAQVGPRPSAIPGAPIPPAAPGPATGDFDDDIPF